MDEIVSLVSHSPLYGLGGFLLIALAVGSLVKRMLRLAFIVLLFIAGYTFHMYEEGAELEDIMSTVLERGQTVGDELENHSDALEDAAGLVKRTADAVKK